jgi:sugar phosphate isomerase/epimerase
MYPLLSKSYKGLFPFNIGTTSFIYPDDYVPNVKMLGPYLENIELLLFESNHTDIAVETISRVAERVAPLNPTTLTLHVPYNETSNDEDDVKSWQERASKNLAKILANGTPSHLISIENLDYPFEFLVPIISELDLSICFDCGHLILHGDDIEKFFTTYSAKTAIIHLYGVQNNHFHGALDQLSEKLVAPTMRLLARFNGIVSMEVFSYAHLDASLKFMEKCWNHQ